MKIRKYLVIAGIGLMLTQSALGAAREVQSCPPIFLPVQTARRQPQQRKVIVREDYARETAAQVNAERLNRGLSPLRTDAELNRAAAVRLYEIAEKFSHTRPDGAPWSTVSRSALGENIAKGHGWPDRVMAAWMTSDGHRRNILRENFGSIGVAAAEIDGVIYWVHLFGR